MKPVFAILGFGLLVLVCQGALATIVPPPWCPDLALLVVIGLGLRWTSLASGLWLATLLGLAADMLSGSLLGQHALLRLLTFASASLASRQLNLKGSMPLVFFAVLLSLGYGFALYAVSRFFVGSAPLAASWAFDLAQHSVVNGICAPWMLAAVSRVLGWAGAEIPTSVSIDIGVRRRRA